MRWRLFQMWLRMLVVICVILVSVFEASGEAREVMWLSRSEIHQEAVTKLLQSISAMDKAEIAELLKAVGSAKQRASEEGLLAIGLISAFAIEQTGDLKAATDAYKTTAAGSASTPYAASAAFRLTTIDNPNRTPKDIDEIYRKLISGESQSGWFQITNQWTWSTTRDAACHALIARRSDRLSFRFFTFLRSHSPFPQSYAYLFILLVLAGGAKIIQLPILAKAAKLADQIRHLQPEIAAIQNNEVYDPQEKQRELTSLYKQHGVNPLGGCAVFFVDLIFVVWALVTLAKFSPQLTLDGARFLWLDDVTQFSWSAGLLWTILSIIVAKIGQPHQSAAILIGGAFVSGGIMLWIAKAFAWPASVFIFWSLLTVVGTLFGKLLQACVRT